MTLIGKFREWAYKPEINQRNQFYRQERSQEEISCWQLERFNYIWRDIQVHVPWYLQKVQNRKLPEQFECWDEFLEKMPILTRKMVRDQYNLFVDKRKKPEVTRVTGGTTSEEAWFPFWKSELAYRRNDMWVGRSWYGISPSDRCLFLWGNLEREKHQNVFGNVWNNRQIKDRLLGYHRFIAFNISRERMRQAGDVLLETQPDYIVGYSVSIEFLVRENLDRQKEFQELNLKGIILTAENLYFPDSEQLISNFFDVPVIQEYGTAENCVIAYTDRDGVYNVFWENLMVEGIGSSQPGKKQALITSLYPRCFPLIRYDVGDLIQFSDGQEKPYSLYRFSKLVGRSVDLVCFGDDVYISSDPFFRAVDGNKDVMAFQIVETGNQVVLSIVYRGILEESVKMLIKNKLRSSDDVLKDVEVIQVEKLHQTKHGKTPIIYKMQSV